MINFGFFKKLFTVLLICLSILVVFLDFNNTTNVVKTKGIKLGLDLKGGAYLVLEANEEVFADDFYKNIENLITSTLIDERVFFNNLKLNKNTITLVLENEDKYKDLLRVITNINKTFEVSNNKNTITIEISKSFYNEQLRSVMENSIEVIRKRIDETGTNEPSIKIQGLNQIVIELPGIENPERLKKLLGTTAQMNFHIVDSEATYGGILKAGYRYVFDFNSNQRYAIKSEPDIYGTDLVNAKLEFQDQQPVVFFSFNTQGAKKFANLTTKQKGKQIAIVLDNKVISAPAVNTPITGGSGIISGSFTVLQAQELALLLRAGSLPTPLVIVEERIVGPTLGAESIKNGAIAGAIGYLIVFFFMIFYYKKLGLIANISLIINTIFILATLSILNATLTLPGIAGIILTIGMAVDANILVYERYKNEIMHFKSSVSVSMLNAFNRVFTTILDSNLTTLFTALFLFSFGSGPIRGFAITLIVGILCSIISIMFVSKLLISILFIKNNKKLKSNRV
jgi:preprotein translocase subunit SecD